MAVVTIDMAEKTWVLLATNVTSGVAERRLDSGAFSFWWTSRPTGQSAPTAEAENVKPEKLDNGNAKPIFEESRYDKINDSDGIDIYGWARNSDDDDTDTVKIDMDL